MSPPHAQGCVSTASEGCVLHLAVVPGAKRTGADGLHDGCLRVRLAAPPVDGKANDALLAWLAAELGLAKRQLKLLRGETSRRKQVALEADAESVRRWVASATAPAAGGKD